MTGIFNACQNTTFMAGLINLLLGGLPPYTFFETGRAANLRYGSSRILMVVLPLRQILILSVHVALNIL